MLALAPPLARQRPAAWFLNMTPPLGTLLTYQFWLVPPLQSHTWMPVPLAVCPACTSRHLLPPPFTNLTTHVFGAVPGTMWNWWLASKSIAGASVGAAPFA